MIQVWISYLKKKEKKNREESISILTLKSITTGYFKKYFVDLPPLLGQGKRQAFEDINYYLMVVETIEILIIQCKSKTVEWDSFKDLKLFNLTLLATLIYVPIEC